MNVAEILDQVSKLTLAEQQQIVDAITKPGNVAEEKTEDEKRRELYRHLLAVGKIKSIPTRQGRPPELQNFKPLEIEGKPVSETIIEERR